VTSFHFEARDWRDPARLRARVHLVVRRSRVSLENPIIGGTAFRRLHAGLTAELTWADIPDAEDLARGLLLQALDRWQIEPPTW
jgi:hypothetical protein